ncbi:M15 family metallopeptidase [Legionella pneumophila]|uniref:M15 family metallopeptidase n=1 Tax=Legionella pneumophila TaxID=446 RepID=UPI000777EDA2|nr:M15 family metallopeptidase [Legionella pneumophila]HAT8666474.1 D-alanyl-D-alanine dipeptidase [Legionella pneumophila]
MKKGPDINEKKINGISIRENNEPLVDLKEQQELAYGPPPDTPLTQNDYTKLRKTVYEKLCLAQKQLPNGWKFRIYEGLRSLNVQKILFDEHYSKLRLKNSNKSEEELFKEASLLIAPVSFFKGGPNIPPHSTGGAVDLEVIGSNGNLIDFGMAIKDWYKVDPDICETYSQNISAEVFQNRKILLDIMYEHDFVNYPREWWHFSYGDRLWAFLKGKQEAIYAGITLVNSHELDERCLGFSYDSTIT